MAEDNKKSGVYAAARDVIDGREEPVTEEQLPLLPLDAGEATRAGAAVPRRGPGRPPGAKNKNTQAVAEWLQRRGQDPLAALQDTIGLPAEDLARRLGCSALEAFKLQLYAAKELAPYMHSKQPADLNLSAPGGFSLTISTEAPEREGAGGGYEGPMIDVTAEAPGGAEGGSGGEGGGDENDGKSEG